MTSMTFPNIYLRNIRRDLHLHILKHDPLARILFRPLGTNATHFLTRAPRLHPVDRVIRLVQ